MLLALLTNNMGILCGHGSGDADDRAAGVVVPYAGKSRGGGNISSCAVGIAQVQFGTILLYFAAEKLLGAEGGAPLWTELDSVKSQPEPTVLASPSSFCWWATAPVGLVPLHNWLPDAHAEGPTPVSAVFRIAAQRRAVCGRALRCWWKARANVARAGADDGSSVSCRSSSPRSCCRGRRTSSGCSRIRPSSTCDYHVCLRHGRAHREFRRTAAHDRAFADQVGDILHGRPRDAEDRHADHGHTRADHDQPDARWGLILGTLAILGMPPFGVFASEFLILITAMHEHPWATPFLLGALGLAFASVFGKVQPMVFGETSAKRLPVRPAMIPVFVHLAIVLMLGLWIPPFLADWYRQAARLIG